MLFAKSVLQVFICHSLEIRGLHKWRYDSSIHFLISNFFECHSSNASKFFLTFQMTGSILSSNRVSTLIKSFLMPEDTIVDAPAEDVVMDNSSKNDPMVAETDPSPSEENNDESAPDGNNPPEDAENASEASDADEDFENSSEIHPANSLRLNPFDASFNAMGSDDGQAMFSMQAEGLNYLFCGMRANLGFTRGRYYFEVKLLDTPRVTRVGFSSAPRNSGSFESSLSGLCLDDEGSYGFDALGNTYTGGVRGKEANPKWSRTDIVGVLLNVPKRSISLFLNGTKTPTGTQSRDLF